MSKADDESIQLGLPRRDFVHRLGVSVSTLRRMEGDFLRPIQDERGVWRFDPDEVQQVGREQVARPAPRLSADAGQVAARAFEAFEAGDELNDIVISLRVRPATVRELYSQWSLDLETGEQERRHALQLAAERRDQRELERLLRPFR